MSRSYEDYRREVDEYLTERRFDIPFRPRPDAPPVRPRPGADAPSPKPKPDGPKKPGRGPKPRDVAAGVGGKTAWDYISDFIRGELSAAKNIIGDKGASIEGKEGTKRAHHTKGN